MNSTNKNLSSIHVPISLGELIDKITILEIKKSHLFDKKLKNVEKELELLKYIIEDKDLKIDISLVNQLKSVNNSLWDIEDRIRIKEFKEEFDEEFINLARSVYKENDKRASIKKEINLIYNSDIIEEKSYAETRLDEI